MTATAPDSPAGSANPVARRQPPAAINPFATRFVQPGAIPYLPHVPGRSLDVLLSDWFKLKAAAVCGPHGSGKSTLLAHLHDRLLSLGCRVLKVQRHDHGRRRFSQFSLPAPNSEPPLPADSAADAPLPPTGTLLPPPSISGRTAVLWDGFEQVPRWQRSGIIRWYRWRGWPLLVTAHGPIANLPVLLDTTVSPSLARQIAESLGGEQIVPSAEELSLRLDAHAGNLREVLFDLYDEYEARA